MLTQYLVESATSIVKGTMVAVNAGGFLVPAANTAGLKVVGVADEDIDNSGGADGDKACRVVSGRVFRFDATSITQAMVGSLMAVADAETFDDVGSNQIIAGLLMEFVSATDGWIWIPVGGFNLTEPAAA